MKTFMRINDYSKKYKIEKKTVREIITNVLENAQQYDDHNIWIIKANKEFLEPYFARLDSLDPASLPLYGIPFAVKDNIDVIGLPTSAACSEFSYMPDAHASVVEQLVAAGAVPIGKTNMDQFAAGLVGTRSPYGEGINLFDEEYISGGSSSGSALAVTAGIVPFSLGTDTAGSGRVPAAFGNIVGLKPTKGSLSNRGVVPACRSLDCVSIFALNCEDAYTVYNLCSAFDTEDFYSRKHVDTRPVIGSFRFGIPREDQLEFFGDSEYRRLFFESLTHLESIGGIRHEIDFASFIQSAKLLYEGPWVAERYAGIASFAQSQSEAMLDVTRTIIASGHKHSAVDTFNSFYKLAELKRQSEMIMESIDILVTPTAGTIYRRSEVRENPFALNSNLGYYTNFMNLLDLCACAIPAGFTNAGLPFGITLVASAWSESSLMMIGERFHALSECGSGLESSKEGESVILAVCGAHMSGLPLNHELTQRGAVLIEKTATSEDYKFFALEEFTPPRPGLVRSREGGSISIELWKIPTQEFGSFFNGVPSPLVLGTVSLIDGRNVKSFLCEHYAVENAKEITQLGGWRNYLS